MGDLNLEIDWITQTGKSSTEEEFVEWIRDGFLEPYIVESAWERAVLDLVLCNEKGLIRDLVVEDPPRG